MNLATHRHMVGVLRRLPVRHRSGVRAALVGASCAWANLRWRLRHPLLYLRVRRRVALLHRGVGTLEV